MSSSILNSLGQGHLITNSSEEYVQKAILASKNIKIVDYVDIPNPTGIDSKSFITNLERLISELD
jgi:predicted O-linked N-acetylglucosamine transferase (SPINDLY family)